MKYILVIWLIFELAVGFSQTQQKTINATRTESAITIDGVLSETIWDQTPAAKDFIQYEPLNGGKSKYNSEVRFIYSNYALYIGAILFDNAPDSIMKQMSKRDELGQTDFFGISLDPFNDAKTGYTFIVSSGNIQFDARQNEDEDASWDAVWHSEVSITSYGWTIEMEIPYSALRFPKKDIQTWGLNIVRNVQRSREKSFWNPVDAKIDGYLKQQGVLNGIKEIEPPIRLSLTPYFSAYLLKNSENTKFDYSLRGGMDLKLGINESYTLDMMLIPDFGQVESDNKEFNISAFETYYEEKRSFFTEGTELFNKAEIFYSRRIGSVKDEYKNKDFNLTETEVIKINPNETDLLNVTKISGKGKNGLGIGLMNGMSAAVYATIEDTLTNLSRQIQTQPFTNYNVLVIDQSLKNNSNISLTNTNYLQAATNYISNVTATQMRFENKNGTHAINGIAGISYLDGLTKTDEIGGAYTINMEKIKGNFRYAIENSLIGKKFNPNDLGYTEKTDIMESQLEVAYNIYNPFWRMLKWHNKIEFNSTLLFSTKEKMGNSIEFSSFTTFRNYLSVNLEGEFNLTEFNDFYEARTDNRVFVRPAVFAIGGFLSPDYRKKFVLDIKGGIWSAYTENINGFWLGFMPIIRFTDQFNMNGGVDFNLDHNDEGFAGKTANNDTIYMAQRDVRTLINSINANFIFNSKMSLSVKVRHYWRLLNFSNFYTLNTFGSLVPENSYWKSDINSNYFNIDLAYTWRFAPGSELSVVWKNSIENENDERAFNYARNFNSLIDNGHQNSISFRFIYYIDYMNVKNRLN